MRLALLIYGSLDTISGGYLYDRMLVNHLRACGDQVDLISLPWRNYIAHLTDNFSPALLRSLRDNRYQAVLQDELNHPSLFLANRLAGATHQPPLRISIVHHLRSSEHRPAWQNLFYRFVEGRYLASVHGFIFNSQTTKRAVESLAGAHRPSVIAYPAGNRFGPPPGPDWIRERAARPGPLKLLFVGNVIPRKGLHILFDALAEIDGGWELNVVGSLSIDSRYVANIQYKIADRRLGKINLLGPAPDSLMAGYYSQSHLLVVPSSYEGFGIVYLEGLGFGLPAIATTAGAAGEIISPGENGFLIAPNDSKALAETIRLLIQDRDLLLKMSLAAREIFLSYPTWEHSADKIRIFIQKMISQRVGGSVMS